MFKRTKGYLLLTMLVLTGLAGRIHSDTLSGKERRTLVRDLKTSKAEFIKSVEGLSGKQFNFRPAKNQLTVKECVYQLASIENGLWATTKTCLKQEALKQARSFNDEELNSCILNQPYIIPARKLKFKNVKEAVKLYKNESAETLKYVNTSTENVRAHVIQTAAGNLDAYQLMFLSAIYTKHITDQINAIKASPKFPK